MLIMKNLCLNYFLTVSIFSIFVGVSTVQAQVSKAQDSKANAPRFIFPSTAWANQPWIGDNRPYHAIRVQIDQSASQGKLNLNVLQAYFKLWQKSPRDPLVLFRWAYADNLAAHRLFLPPHPDPGEGAFEDSLDPHTYDYERIRFLITWPGNEIVLLPLAKRLLAHDPQDYPVQYNLVGRYGGTDSPAEKAASIARAENLLAQYPNKPEIYAVIGGIYCDHWIFQKNAADGQKAILYYQKYLQLASPDDPWRKQAKFWISQINHRTL